MIHNFGALLKCKVHFQTLSRRKIEITAANSKPQRFMVMAKPQRLKGHGETENDLSRILFSPCPLSLRGLNIRLEKV